MAATLIVYMKGEQRKADEEKVRKAKVERARRGGEATPQDRRAREARQNTRQKRQRGKEWPRHTRGRRIGTKGGWR